MTKTSMSVIAMMEARIVALHRQATKLARMAGASACARERLNLRNESKGYKRQAEALQIRLDKLIGKKVSNHDQAL